MEQAYTRFDGGMNTVSSNDKLSDRELRKAINVDILERGSPKRRAGMEEYLSGAFEGTPQGYFRYFQKDGSFVEIRAVGGFLYKDGAKLDITGLTEGFQATKVIDALQYGDTLYFATGTKLVEYREYEDEENPGTILKEAKVVEPYKPNSLDVLYIGTNALSDDPDAWIADGEAEFLRLDGVSVDNRKGIVNEPSTFSAFVSKPPDSTINYKFMYRKKGANSFTLGKDYSTESTWTFTFPTADKYEIDVYAREGTDTTTEVLYNIPEYEVFAQDENEEKEEYTLHGCTRLLLYWDRLIMYGDTEKPKRMYISDLENPRYFPASNSLDFESEKNGRLTELLKFRDFLIGFTENTVQAVHGKEPRDFVRSTINTDLGCIADRAACVMENVVSFLSKDGIYSLVSTQVVEDRLNVERIDTKINNELPDSKNVRFVSFDKQLHVFYPDEQKRFRFYYERGSWVMDVSPYLDFSNVYEWDGKLYGVRSGGSVAVFNPSLFKDLEHVFESEIETRGFDFGDPLRTKKMKELQLLVGHFKNNVGLKVYAFADSTVVLDPEKRYAIVDANGNVVWNVENTPNVDVLAGTIFGEWILGESQWGNVESSVKKNRISGRCRNIKVRILHNEDTPFQINGIGFRFVMGDI